MACVGTACLAMFLLATTAGALHFCDLPIGGVGTSASVRMDSSNSVPSGTPCFTCLMAQSAAAAFVFFILFPTHSRNLVSQSLRVQPRSFLDSFRLYVRPPPAY